MAVWRLVRWILQLWSEDKVQSFDQREHWVHASQQASQPANYSTHTAQQRPRLSNDEKRRKGVFIARKQVLFSWIICLLSKKTTGSLISTAIELSSFTELCKEVCCSSVSVSVWCWVLINLCNMVSASHLAFPNWLCDAVAAAAVRMRVHQELCFAYAHTYASHRQNHMCVNISLQQNESFQFLQQRNLAKRPGNFALQWRPWVKKKSFPSSNSLALFQVVEKELRRI